MIEEYLPTSNCTFNLAVQRTVSTVLPKEQTGIWFITTLSGSMPLSIELSQFIFLFLLRISFSAKSLSCLLNVTRSFLINCHT